MWDNMAALLDTAFIPLWLVCVVVIGFLCVMLWRDLTLAARRDPPTD